MLRTTENVAVPPDSVVVNPEIGVTEIPAVVTGVTIVPLMEYCPKLP